jgi:hypothetical protein
MPDQQQAVQIGAGKAAPNLLQQAQQQYPVLQKQNYGYVENFQQGGGFLEHWSAGEPGEAPTAPGSLDGLRPKQLPLDQPGLEIRDPKTRPIDVLGDIVSHNLVNTDPNIKSVYENFQKSITPKQQALLQEQFKYAQANEGEQRPFEEWLESAGLPGLFRGYAFDQWPKEFNDQVYTPEQKQMFDGMMNYLKTGKDQLSRTKEKADQNGEYIKALKAKGNNSAP